MSWMPLTTVYTYVMYRLRYRQFKSFQKVPCALLQSISCLLEKKTMILISSQIFSTNNFLPKISCGCYFWVHILKRENLIG